MKRPLLVILFAVGALVSSPAAAVPVEPSPQAAGLWEQIRPIIEQYLGKPYVWGASGLKSFDCSGFVWRVMWDKGILIKRTTARKLFMSLPTVPRDRRWDAGNIVFFDDMKHCGIVAGPNQFYHAESSTGTNLSAFDPYWRRKVCGFRALPQ